MTWRADELLRDRNTRVSVCVCVRVCARACVCVYAFWIFTAETVEVATAKSAQEQTSRSTFKYSFMVMLSEVPVNQNTHASTPHAFLPVLFYVLYTRLKESIPMCVYNDFEVRLLLHIVRRLLKRYNRLWFSNFCSKKA